MSATLAVAVFCGVTVCFGLGFLLACIFITGRQRGRDDREWEAAGDFPNVPRRERIFHGANNDR